MKIEANPPQSPIKQLIKQSYQDIGPKASLIPLYCNSSGKQFHAIPQNTNDMINAARIGCHFKFHSTPSGLVGLKIDNPQIDMKIEVRSPVEIIMRGK